jgi:hypothetical protein
VAPFQLGLFLYNASKAGLDHPAQAVGPTLACKNVGVHSDLPHIIAMLVNDPSWKDWGTHVVKKLSLCRAV